MNAFLWVSDSLHPSQAWLSQARLMHHSSFSPCSCFCQVTNPPPHKKLLQHWQHTHSPTQSHCAKTHIICSLLNHELQLQRGLPHGPLIQILQHTDTSREYLAQFKLHPQSVPSAPMVTTVRSPQSGGLHCSNARLGNY